MLSLSTAKKLFATEISLILTYGIQQILEHFTEGGLTIFENVKGKYLKEILCVKIHGVTAHIHLGQGTLPNRRIEKRMATKECGYVPDVLHQRSQKGMNEN